MYLILSRYVIKHFLVMLAIVICALSIVLSLFDTVELLRRLHDQSIQIFVIMQMIALKLPDRLQETMPFIILISSMLSLIQFNRHHELIVMKSIGISVWHFIIPQTIIVIIIGIFIVTIWNPFSSLTLRNVDRLEAKYLGSSNETAVFSSGFWFRDIAPDKKTYRIFHASHAKENLSQFENVSIFIFDKQNRFLERIDSDSLLLGHDSWLIHNLLRSTNSIIQQHHDNTELPTETDLSILKNGFAFPRTISFWQLPNFIEALSISGLNSISYQIYFYNLCLYPLFLAIMFVIGAAFSTYMPRESKPINAVIRGTIAGFAIFFINKLIYVLGTSSFLPITMSAFLPIAIPALTAYYLVLHYND